MLMNGWYQSGNGIVSPSQIPWSLYDVVYNFAASPNPNGTINLQWLDPTEIQQIVATGHAAGKKVLVVVKDEGANQFAPVTTPGMISTFVANLTKFVQNNNFDGVSIDWEQAIIVSQYQDLLTRLRANLGNSKMIMCDMGDWQNMPTVAQSRQNIVDGFNIMCYAMSNNSPNQTLFDAMTFTGSTGLRAMDSRMKAFSSVTPSKLLLGIPFFGVRWIGASQPVVFGNFNAPASVFYHDLVKDPVWSSGSQQYDVANAGSYVSATSSNQFIPYVSPRQISDIVAWAKSQGFGGIAPFTLSYDDAPAFTLSNSLRNAISGSQPVRPDYSGFIQPNGDILLKKL